MAKVVVMPKLGLTMTEGTIGSWYKQEGDQVSTGEKLFTVETDKLTNDIESNTAGVLRRILRPAGDTIPCNGPVAIIAAADEDIGALMARSEGAGAPADTDDAAAGQARQRLRRHRPEQRRSRHRADVSLPLRRRKSWPPNMELS